MSKLSLDTQLRGETEFRHEESTPGGKYRKILLKEQDDGAERVIRVLKYHHACARGRKRKRLQAQLTYFRNQRPRMHYAEYIRNSLPIASGSGKRPAKLSSPNASSNLAWLGPWRADNPS